MPIGPITRKHEGRNMRVSGHWNVTAALALLLIGTAIPAQAQSANFPDHPVRIITDSAPGSSIDVPTRIIAEGLSKIWGQQAVVINQPGAGGAIAAHNAASATPDGYTLEVTAASAFVALPGTADNIPIQVPKDFTPVGYIGGAPMFITAAPWLDVKTLPDLIALAKQKPGDVSYGANGIGRLTHLTGELLQAKAGIKLLMVPYSGGTAQIISDMMGKRIGLVLDAYSGIQGAIDAGNAVPLAVASAQRLAVSPNLPTVAETLPGFEAVGWQVLLAPAGTPDAIVKKANAD
jgi:tripartite-type tricarboxylate transporter receptor subunit TctC